MKSISADQLAKQVVREGLQVVEEGPPHDKFGPHPAILLVTQLQDGMKQERQQVEHDQDQG